MNITNKVNKILWLLLLVFTVNIHGQNTSSIGKYWVVFKDKPEIKFNPYTYFDQKAIDRRLAQKLPLYDWTDLPLNSVYTNEVANLVQEVKMESRWFNAVVVYADVNQISKLEQLPYIKTIDFAGNLDVMIADFDTTGEDFDDEDLIGRQISRMGADQFEARNLHGEGMRIAIFDVGFSGADRHAAFEHIRRAGRIKKTWDFVAKRENVWEGGSHGTSVWSCIGGRMKDQWSGMAHEAEFILARTEIGSREPFSEEENWVAAAEWADKNGADIINSSLGYTSKRYFPRQMNGKHTYITRGANMAARKGMLVVNAAGNEGNSSWRIMGAPADADSVLSIGGLEPCCDYHISFSSFGPTYDLRLKPNVSAQGRAWCAKTNGEGPADGTSFASPLAAGFAACAWQADKSLSNMQLFKKLEESASLYPFFDYAHGYGVLNAERFLNGVNVIDPTMFVQKDDSGEFYKVMILESQFTQDTTYGSQLLYVAVMNPSGALDSYKVIDVSSTEPFSFAKNDFIEGRKVRLSYKGYLLEIQL
jgi:subtilisin family serine protease